MIGHLGVLLVPAEELLVLGFMDSLNLKMANNTSRQLVLLRSN